ncbi:MAG TPA: DNA-processing protein DprA [Lamprocystis sp. (in: g-proteobacteria)]|nr:DNA-processing protein DprA [Lamprocystis sp. (in: g-proteobacteria)]
MSPDRLLVGNLDESLSGWTDKKIDHNRLRGLLDRGSALAFATEKWLRAGLWVLTRSDPDYPSALKQILKTDAPPVLFGCGNKQILNRKGIGVVGSRDASEDDLAFARGVGTLASKQGESIVSGGARGIDEAAMLGALETEGTAVGVLADSLLRACTSKKYRPYLFGNSLTLLSPFNPEAGFNAGNAMARNKYVYCMSAAVIVVHSGTGGGTWNGATENLKKGWVPLWVKTSSDPEAGNGKLVAMGGKWIDEELKAINFDQLKHTLTGASPQTVGDLLPPHLVPAESGGSIDSVPAGGMQPVVASEPEPPLSGADKAQGTRGGPEAASSEQAKEERAEGENRARMLADASFYDLFLTKVEQLCRERGRKEEEFAEVMDVAKTQLKQWLSRAVDEERLRKSGRPIRYEWRGAERQLTMFDR